jgi:hypothetical protein
MAEAIWLRRYLDGSRRRNRGAPSSAICGTRLDEREVAPCHAAPSAGNFEHRLFAVGQRFIIVEGVGKGDPRSRAEIWSIQFISDEG